MDVYNRHIQNCISEIEESYDLHTLLQANQKISDLDIKEFMEQLSFMATSISDKLIVEYNIKVGEKVVVLAYLNSRLKFFKYARLDYDLYPSIDLLVKCLQAFLSKDTITSQAKSSVNMIPELLAQMEEKNIQYKRSLGYRCLRLFVVMIAYRNYTDASIMAELILNQILSARSVKNARASERAGSTNTDGGKSVRGRNKANLGG